jgi:hypothetical protein
MLGSVVVAFSGQGQVQSFSLEPGPTMAAFPAARPAWTPATIAGGSARRSYTTSGDIIHIAGQVVPLHREDWQQ